MIPSTPSSNRPFRPESTPPVAPKTSGASRGPGADHLSLEHVELLRQALAAQPEIRSDVVARGRALAADPAWPSHDVLRKVSEIILRAPDLTEDLA
jgi:hypothetical protein